jgi:hypothetical protein
MTKMHQIAYRIIKNVGGNTSGPPSAAAPYPGGGVGRSWREDVRKGRGTDTPGPCRSSTIPTTLKCKCPK